MPNLVDYREQTFKSSRAGYYTDLIFKCTDQTGLAWNPSTGAPKLPNQDEDFVVLETPGIYLTLPIRMFRKWFIEYEHPTAPGTIHGQDDISDT